MKRFCLSGVLLVLLIMVSSFAHAAATITSSGGWFESAYVEFTPDGSAYYNVYYSTSGSGPWTKIDDQLVRKYGSSKGRADVLGLSAGTYYIKVASVNASGTETANVVTGALTVKAHNRGGFAHFNNANKVGAYKDDGTLKSGANILYITKSNAKTITMTVPSASNKTTIYTGLQTIINAWTKAYSNGWSTAPLDIRVLGTLSYDDMDTFSSSAEGIQIKGASGYANCPITFEGVGNDAVIHGFGFLVRNMQNLEMRNFAIMNCLDDCVSLDSNNSHIWVHNLDLFYGNAGSDKDQVKGDGTIDLKGDSQYITISYNHFWDSGKSSLCGMKSESGPNYITYHHNWFDHSDSRHPRIRTMSVHVYNNYFDGVSKYGAGVTTGASCFVDRNYFRSCKFPMLSSMQGSDVYAGTTTRNPDSNGTFSGENSGVIKSYGNVITGNCTYIPYGASTYLLHGTSTATGNIDSSVDFDAYEVSSPSQTVPSTVKGYLGGSTYNNFDQSMYSYTADAADDVPTIVKGTYGAGRMQHGTYQHTFTEADDTDYGVIASLKSDVQGYKSTSYYVGVTNSMYFKDGVITDSAVEGGGGEEEPTPTTSDDATLKSLNVSGYSLSFSSNTTYYAVTLKYGTESAPTVSATANNSNATVTITQATSTTGKATVKVTAENGTTIKLYEVQFSVAAEPVVDGSSISNAMTINVGDGSDNYKSYLSGTYNTSTSCNATFGGVTNSSLSIKMESSTSISFTTTKAFTMTFVADASQTASFKIDGTTVTGTGNTVSVDVAAGTHTLTKSGAIKMCFLDFADVTSEPDPTPTQSSDATLSALSVAGYTLAPAFSSSTFTYSVELAAGTTSVPAITATPNDAKAKAYVDTENCHPAGQAIIDVEAEDGTSSKYYINFTVASAFYNVSASAGAGGSASVSPSGSVAEGTSVTFTATPNSGYVFSKWSDNSTENPHTITVTGDVALTAQFVANATPSGDDKYKDIAAESDNPYIFTTFTETGLVADWITETNIDHTKDNTGGTKKYIDPETDVNNNSESKIACNGVQIKNNRFITFHVKNASKATVYGFHSNSSATRNLVISSGESNSQSVGVAPGSAYSVSITLDGSETDVKVATDETSGVYVYAIKFEPSSNPVVTKSSDATLSDLTVNGTTIAGFNASTTVYNVSLPYGTTIVPTVAASKNDSGASVSITQASSTTGSASVVVTAEDGTTVKTYTVNFSVSTSLVLTDAANYVDGTFAAGNVTYTRATVDGNYGSFCLPFDFNLSETSGLEKVYVPVNIALLNTQTNLLRLFLAPKTGVISAGTPFLAKNNGATTIVNSANVTFATEMTNPASTIIRVFDTNDANGLLTEDEDVQLTWNGTYVRTDRVDGMKSFNTDGSFGDHNSSTLAPFRAYLVKSGNNAQSIEIELLFTDDATDINAIKQNINSNGDVMYNLNGQRVNPSAAKGIYIKNGVKVIR